MVTGQAAKGSEGQTVASGHHEIDKIPRIHRDLLVRPALVWSGMFGQIE